jgi:transcriptional regulator with XRE-family HTH domain
VDSYRSTTTAASADFARRLREAIDHSDYSLRELHAKTGIDKNTISGWQNPDAARRPKSVSLAKVSLIADVLGLDPGLLLGIPAPSEEAAKRERLLSELHQELESLRGRRQSWPRDWPPSSSSPRHSPS